MMSQRNWKGRYFWLRLPKQRCYSEWNVTIVICVTHNVSLEPPKSIDYVLFNIYNTKAQSFDVFFRLPIAIEFFHKSDTNPFAVVPARGSEREAGSEERMVIIVKN